MRSAASIIQIIKCTRKEIIYGENLIAYIRATLQSHNTWAITNELPKILGNNSLLTLAPHRFDDEYISKGRNINELRDDKAKLDAINFPYLSYTTTIEGILRETNDIDALMIKLTEAQAAFDHDNDLTQVRESQQRNPAISPSTSGHYQQQSTGSGPSNYNPQIYGDGFGSMISEPQQQHSTGFAPPGFNFQDHYGNGFSPFVSKPQQQHTPSFPSPDYIYPELYSNNSNPSVSEPQQQHMTGFPSTDYNYQDQYDNSFAPSVSTPQQSNNISSVPSSYNAQEQYNATFFPSGSTFQHSSYLPVTPSMPEPQQPANTNSVPLTLAPERHFPQYGFTNLEVDHNSSNNREFEFTFSSGQPIPSSQLTITPLEWEVITKNYRKRQSEHNNRTGNTPDTVDS